MKTSTQKVIEERHAQVGLLISDYQDGLINEADRTAVEQHLAECEACQKLFGKLEQVRQVVTNLPNASTTTNRTEYKAVMLRTIYQEKAAALEKNRRISQKKLFKQEEAERKAKKKADSAKQKEERLHDWHDSKEKIEK